MRSSPAKASTGRLSGTDWRASHAPAGERRELQPAYEEKARRYQELARELATEANRSNVNANVLGQRYVEQQMICRELRAAHQANYDRNQTVLSAEQKGRLRVFDDVITHNNLALNAGFEFLMEEPTSGVAFASIGGTPMNTALNPSKPLCGVPMIAPIGGQAQ